MIPQRNRIPSPMCRLDRMRIPAIRPEEQYSIKLRCYIQHWHILRIHSQDPAIRRCIPVRIEVVGSRDASPIPIRIVYVLYVTRTRTRITRHHCLEEMKNKLISRINRGRRVRFSNAWTFVFIDTNFVWDQSEVKRAEMCVRDFLHGRDSMHRRRLGIKFSLYPPPSFFAAHST